jgi:hypothetical protein
MSPLRYSAFTLGGLASLAAAAAGIAIYASHPGSNFYLIGWDELQHREFAQLLLHGGSGSIFANMLQGQALTGDATWGTGLLIGLCVYCFGSELTFIALKWVLHVLATLLLYRLVRKYRDERVAGYAAFFFLIYPPLLLYGASFLKDDLVAALVIITAAAIDRKWYIAAAPLMLIMIAVRANAVLFPLILVGYLRHARLRYLLLVSAIPIAVVMSLLPGYVQAMESVLHLPPATVLFFVIKYLLGPLPGNLLSYQSEAAWILPWYALSFLAILGAFFLPGFYSSVRRNWKWIALLTAVCLAPYLPYVQYADVVGPRQFASVGWLYFLLCYERLLRYGFSVEPQPASEARWSAAT